MDESGVDLSYDESRAAAAAAARMAGVQQPRGPTPSERIRVVVGSRQVPSSFPSSVSHSLGKTKLRSSQRLQLMKLQAEAESARMCMVQKKSSAEMLSIPATTNNAFLTNLQHRYSATPSPRSSGSIPPNLHDYAAMNSRSTIDDEDEMLKDLEGVLGEEFSSYESSFNIPSVANSCIADFPNDLQDVQMEEDKGQTSSSCPLIPLRPAEQILPYRGGRKKEPPPVFMSEESKIQWLKEREKKDQHNTIEKKRRSKINDYIHELATLLPENYDIDLQNKKGNILEASVDYIRKLQGDEKRMAQMKKQQDDLERQNRKLQLQIQLLQMMNASQVNQPPIHVPVQQPAAPVMQPPSQVQFSDVFDLNPGALHCDTDALDLLHSDLDMMHDTFDLAQLDPIFASLQVEAVTNPDAAGSAMTSTSQIPLMVDEIMEYNI